MLKVKLAEINDLEWVNEKYKDIEFVLSDLARERVAIAELDGEKAGLGRLVAIDKKHAELGGMYVFENFRNQGIASAIVEFLLAQGENFQTIIVCPSSS